MRVSVPTIPDAVLRSAADAAGRRIAPAAAVQRVADFLSHGKTAVITGAGVSVDSGIRAYRGNSGRYLNPNYKCVSLFFRVSPPFPDISTDRSLCVPSIHCARLRCAEGGVVS